MMKTLENEMSQVTQTLVEMGLVAEGMLTDANNCIKDATNEVMYTKVVDDEERLGLMQIEVEQEVVRLLSIFDPMPGDLRLLLTASWIATELERIGDQVVNMCESLRLMAAKSEAVPLPRLIKLSEVVAGMVQDGNTALVENDASLARSVLVRDELVDALNSQIVHELLSDEVLCGARNNPDEIAAALAHVLIARSLQRIADKSTNISEKVIYRVNGHEHESEKGVRNLLLR